MSEQETRQLAQRFIEALRRVESGGESEVDALVALFADDAELFNPQLDHRGERARDRDGVRAFWRNYCAAFGHVRSEFKTVTSNGEAAGLFWESRGTDAQGASIDYHGATLLMFDAAGKIRYFRGYFDTRALEPPGRG